jgi:3'(2'), 5'-bisphosphate nucleotidase
VTADLDSLLAIARDAAQAIMEVYGRSFEVDYKAPDDPVTEADRRANALICERLAVAFPSVPVVAEESAPEHYAGFREHHRILFVDPVDGTREFVDRNGEFVVMIGLVEGERARCGVVLAPTTGVAWCGEVGKGAYRVSEGGQLQPLSVSGCEARQAARLVASRTHRSIAVQRALDRLGVAEIRALGSAGLKGAAVAAGEADLYVAPGYAGMLWDACAIDALVTSAGGAFSDTFGAAIDYRGELDNRRGLLATNGRLHAGLVELITQLG